MPAAATDLLQKVGQANVIFTEGYNDSSILLSNNKICKISLLKYLKDKRTT
mgnify:CR=1 FL=1